MLLEVHKKDLRYEIILSLMLPNILRQPNKQNP